MVTGEDHAIPQLAERETGEYVCDLAWESLIGPLLQISHPLYPMRSRTL